MHFSKYFALAKNTLQEYFAYRINFLFWRLQVLTSFFVFYFLWASVAKNQSHVGIYDLPKLYTYFTIGYIIRALVFSTRTADLGSEIQTGNLSNLLVKPVGVLKYYFSRDLIDKLFNLFFMTFEFIFILLSLKPALFIPASIDFLLFLLSTLMAVVIFFLYSLTISLATFWSDQAWSSRFLFGVVFVNLFSGQFIPLDLLPQAVNKILVYTPFPYLYYYPVKFWLGLIPQSQILFIFLNSLFTLLFFYFLSRLLWTNGIKKYQSYGH